MNYNSLRFTYTKQLLSSLITRTGTRVGKQYKPHNESDWSVNTRYVYGAYGELLAQYSGATPQYWNILAGGESLGRTLAGRVVRGQERAYYLKDHLGSVRVTVTEDGSVLEQEGGLGIYHAGARLYDPEVPRFYGVDAMRSAMPSWNAYHYTFNNPVRYVDPDGNCPQPANTDGTICVSLFIQKESVLGLKGDGRDFSSNYEPEKSRFFVHIDIENQTAAIEVNETCTTGGRCEPASPKNEIGVSFGEDGEITLFFDAKNSVLPGPAINGEIQFTPDGKGGFNTSGNRDAFPSAEAYLWKEGQPTMLFESQEKTPLHLFPFMPKDRFKK